MSTNANNLFGTVADGRLMYPHMQGLCSLLFWPQILSDTRIGSSGEAAFMTGLERNSDIVFAASYAPLLMVGLMICYNQSDTNIITIERCQLSVDAQPDCIRVSHSKRMRCVSDPRLFSASQVYPSTSYYTQQVVISDVQVNLCHSYIGCSSSVSTEEQSISQAPCPL